MMRARVCMIAGLTGIVAIMPANASEQDCPEWLRWACPNGASSGAVRQVVPRERQRARTPAASSSQMDPTTKHVRAALDGATLQQTKRWETARAPSESSRAPAAAIRPAISAMLVRTRRCNERPRKGGAIPRVFGVAKSAPPECRCRSVMGVSG